MIIKRKMMLGPCQHIWQHRKSILFFTVECRIRSIAAEKQRVWDEGEINISIWMQYRMDGFNFIKFSVEQLFSLIYFHFYSKWNYYSYTGINYCVRAFEHANSFADLPYTFCSVRGLWSMCKCMDFYSVKFK